MITVPAMRLHQFGVYFYQAILGVRDVQKLVRFEVLSYDDGGRTHGKRPVKTQRAGKINWDVLEQRIAHSAEAYQRPVIQKKIGELMDYYLQCADVQNLPAIPGVVLLTCERRLDFIPISSHRILGVLQLPPEGGALRALDGQHRLLALHHGGTAPDRRGPGPRRHLRPPDPGPGRRTLRDHQRQAHQTQSVPPDLAVRPRYSKTPNFAQGLKVP